MRKGAVLGFFAYLLYFTQTGFAQDSVGYLVTQTRDPLGVQRPSATPYVPCEGDLVFFNDHSQKWHFLYKLVGSDWPFHASIICKLPDGRTAIAEAGPNDTLSCRVLEISPRLHGFKGTVYVRRCKVALSPEASKAMTDWCVAQDNKRYALGRLLLQATPFRCRGRLRSDFFGETDTQRSAYLCAELAVAAGTVAGLFDPTRHKANTIYPRDIFYNDIHDLSHIYHDVQVWSATPSGLQTVFLGKYDRNASLISALPQQK
jgi:hypothetical protein